MYLYNIFTIFVEKRCFHAEGNIPQPFSTVQRVRRYIYGHGIRCLMAIVINSLIAVLAASAVFLIGMLVVNAKKKDSE